MFVLILGFIHFSSVFHHPAKGSTWNFDRTRWRYDYFSLKLAVPTQAAVCLALLLLLALFPFLMESFDKRYGLWLCGTDHPISHTQITAK